MAKAGQRKCMSCAEFFDSDHRNRNRQIFCSAAGCRRASKAASQARWLNDPDNVGYFKDQAHVARARAWREAHPGHTRGTPRKSPALQDPLIAQALDFNEENGKRTGAALQDLLNPSSPALAGLIAHLFGVTLQDDLTATAKRLVQIGRDLLRSEVHTSSDASHEGRKASQAQTDVRSGVSRPTA
jgi:hypothetical protein